MSGMNEFLADLYKTAETIGASTTPQASSSDVEKLAQAEIVDQYLQSKGLDVEKLAAADILQVAAEIFGPDNELAKMAADMNAHEKAETPAEERKEEEEKKEKEAAARAEKEAMEKAAEADLLGRQMAHAFVQELGNIEKTANVGQAVKNWGQLAGHVAGKAGEAVKANPGLAAGATAAGAGTGFAAGRMSKTASATPDVSAIDMLAEKRAMDILKANGIGVEVTEQEKLAAAVEARAWEMLQAAGYEKAPE